GAQPLAGDGEVREGAVEPRAGGGPVAEREGGRAGDSRRDRRERSLDLDTGQARRDGAAPAVEAAGPGEHDLVADVGDEEDRVARPEAAAGADVVARHRHAQVAGDVAVAERGAEVQAAAGGRRLEAQRAPE